MSKKATRFMTAALLGVSTALIAAAPASASTGVSGYIQCESMPVEGIWIAAASGGSGWASWYPVDGGGTYAYYSYSLPSGGSYAVHVGCGGSWQNWRVPAYSGYYGGTTNDFFCFDEPWESLYKYCEKTN